jgi:hypothetical protein
MTRRAARSRDEYLAGSIATQARSLGLSPAALRKRLQRERDRAKALLPGNVTSPQPAVCPALPSQKAFVAPVTPELTPAQFAAARARVEALLAGMAAENERRMVDWGKLPLPDWREGYLEMRSSDGEITIIELSKRDRGKEMAGNESKAIQSAA